MSIINKFTSELAYFMAKSFMPTIVTIRFYENINNVKYDNSLFQSYGHKKEGYFRFINNNAKNNFIKTPEQFLKKFSKKKERN